MRHTRATPRERKATTEYSVQYTVVLSVYVTPNLSVTNVAPSLSPPRPSLSRGAAPSGRPTPQRLRATWRHACSRSKSSWLVTHPTSLPWLHDTRLRSHERLLDDRHGAVVGAAARSVRKRLGNCSTASGSRPDRAHGLPVCVSSLVTRCKTLQ